MRPINYIGLLKKAQLNYRSNVLTRQKIDVGPIVEVEVEVPLPEHDDGAGAVGGSRDTDGPSTASLQLMQLPQLYDSTHLANTTWYRSLFSLQYSAKRVGIGRGLFPEDIVSTYMLKLAKANGADTVVATFGTYLDTSAVVIAHIDGRRFLDPVQREARGWPKYFDERYRPNHAK